MAELERIEVERIERDKYRFYRVLGSEDRQAGRSITDAHLFAPGELLELAAYVEQKRAQLEQEAHEIETHFRSPQLHLWQTSDTEWLLALRRPEPAQRRNRGKIVMLARQLSLLDVSATG